MFLNIKEFLEKSSLPQKIIYTIYILSFLIATTTHVRDIILGGFLPYRTMPLWANVYWTSLVIADPLAVILLLLKLKTGLKMYGVIIVSDVIINLYFTVAEKGIPGIINLFMISQIAFMLFLLFTIKRIQEHDG